MKLPADSTDVDSVIARRSAIRRERLAAREALDASAHRSLSAAIEARLTALYSATAPKCIGFCWPIRNEFDARPFVLRLIEIGWQAVMPVVETPNEPMVFRRWTIDIPMMTDPHGIPIPIPTPTANASTGRQDLVPNILLVPLIAFDNQRYRLGYGGGYFDRTLPLCVPRPIVVGVGFELGRVPTTYPQAHDQACDLIITELS